MSQIMQEFNPGKASSSQKSRKQVAQNLEPQNYYNMVKYNCANNGGGIYTQKNLDMAAYDPYGISNLSNFNSTQKTEAQYALGGGGINTGGANTIQKNSMQGNKKMKSNHSLMEEKERGNKTNNAIRHNNLLLNQQIRNVFPPIELSPTNYTKTKHHHQHQNQN